MDFLKIFQYLEKNSWFLLTNCMKWFVFFGIFSMFRLCIQVRIGYLKDICKFYYLIMHYFQSRKSRDWSRDQLFQFRIPGLKNNLECINTNYNYFFKEPYILLEILLNTCVQQGSIGMHAYGIHLHDNASSKWQLGNWIACLYEYIENTTIQDTTDNEDQLIKREWY